MSDLSLNIMDRVFHFGVKPEDEDRLRACGEELDRQMRSIRESGRVLGYDQVAVMVALDLIWGRLAYEDAAKRSKAMESEATARLSELREQCEAAVARIGSDDSPAEKQPPQPES